MSGYFASVNGLQVVGGSLLIPLIGMWTADLRLATSQMVTGQATVVIGNLSLLGTVYRADDYGGQVRVRMVGGYGGWRVSIPPQGYGNASGVQLSTVLQDAASACGEQVNVSSNPNVGNAYVRTQFPTSVAGDVLWQMLSQGFIPAWYVGPSGVTQIAAWPTVSVSTPFTVTDQKPDEGLVTIATEDYASWLPGCTFTSPLLASPQTSAGVHYVWGADGNFRFEVFTGTTGDRVLGPFQQMVEREVAPLRFFGRYEYSISNPSTSTIDGSPTDPSLGLPDVQQVPLGGDSISSYIPPTGGTAHIMFVNGQPTKPVCVWTSGNPTNVAIQGGANPAAKLGDTVQSMVTGTLTVLGGALTVGSTAGTPTGTIIVQGLSPISGTITTGSAQLEVPN